MAEFTRTPYVTILKYALVPALLYYLMVWTAVHYQARRMGMAGLTKDQLPALWPLLRRRGSLFIPLIVLTWLIVIGYSPTLACIYAVAAVIVVAAVTPATRDLVTVGNILRAVRQGAEASVPLFAASACAGIIVGVVTLTGLGLKISTLIIDISYGYSVIALLLSAVTCIIFGLGLPTQIIYLTLAVLVAPGLVEMGIPMPAAHLFIMYFGMMSMVTPPVCFAAFAAAALSGAPMMQTGIQACKLAVAGLLVPFYFVYNPGLLLIGSGFEIVEAVVRALVGLAAAGIAIGIVPLPGNGRPAGDQTAFAVAARAAFAGVALALVSPVLTFVAVGGGLLVLGLALSLVPQRARIGDNGSGTAAPRDS
jgi:TRAP transporter 4TM/12TM fusion protein